MGWLCLASLLLLYGGLGCSGAEPVRYGGPIAEWPEYGGDKGGLRYSPLDQVDVDNVADLEIVWVYRHGDRSDGSGDWARTSFQATPIVTDGTMYFCTAFARVIALDPETGAERWTFDPELKGRRGKGPYPLTCRGVAYWPGDGTPGVCARRIFIGTRDSELIALDAATGKPCADFGRAGRVALRDGLAEAPDWEYYPTSPPVIVENRVILGALVADSLRADAPSGVVRAFDAKSGALSWAWDPVPPDWPKESAPGQARFQSGTPNVWAPISADAERGLVFVPTGNASPDSFGGARQGLDFYGSSTVALDTHTGAVRWHYQFVHHDVWDYDTASQPSLFELDAVGGGRAGVAQVTKMGHIFLLDRETGEPLYPVEERPVPQAGAVPGESLSPTQPFPTHPAPIHAARLDPSDFWGFTPIDAADCRARFGDYRNEGIFTPPSLEGSLQFPGSAGGANWGGAAIDPGSARLIVNQNHMPMIQQLIPRAEFDRLDPDSVVYPDELYPMQGTPYGVKRMAVLSNFGAPCNPPPWGSLSAVDLASGELVWQVSLGTTRDQAPFPMWLSLGSPNLGGPIVTAGGLVFIGATTDKFLRAFSLLDGTEVFSARLPYTANATPLTYRLRGDSKQFIVVAAGGHGWSEPGDAVVAFALP